jgi:hypothetical protein
MDKMLLAAAAGLAALAVPAQAEVSASHDFSVARSSQASGSPVFQACRGGGHHRRGNAGCNGAVVFDVYGGDWARYNNRSFEPDSYNDWWHDRPDRAFPRWMQSNRNCDRVWWSGGGWRC